MAENELVTFAPDNPVAILSDAKQFDALLGRIQAEVDAHVPDLETVKGRAAIKSLAYKVTRTKTALDDAGKELNATKRAEIDAVDSVRRDVRAKLDALADKARKPLDDWEAAEAARLAHINDRLAFIDMILVRVNDLDASSAYVSGELSALEKMQFDAEIFQDQLGTALTKKAAALETLASIRYRLAKAEADAIELAALRQREQERTEREAANKAEADLAALEKAETERREREAREVEDARIEAARIAEEKRLADIKAAEERAANEAAAKTEREAQAKIDKANAEAAALKKAADDRVAADKKAADDLAAREADKAHRGKIMKAAKEAIMEHGGVSEDIARKIVLAIVAREIPNVGMNF